MELLEPFDVDPDWRAPVVARAAECRWLAVPMIYNVRLVCVPDDSTGIAAFGWCYRTELALLAAVRVFDPVTQDEPLGWHKRAGGLPRWAPEREADPEYNQPRCEHGTYLHTGICDVTVHCYDFLQSIRKGAR
jgi:hypothetical protein